MKTIQIGDIHFKDVSAEILHPSAKENGVYDYVPVTFDWAAKEIIFEGKYNGHWENRVEQHGGDCYIRGELIRDGAGPVTTEVVRDWVEDDCIYPPETFAMPDELKQVFVLNDPTPLTVSTAATSKTAGDWTVLVSPENEVKYYYSYSRAIWRAANKMKSPLCLEHGRGPSRADKSEKLLVRAREQGLNIIG